MIQSFLIAAKGYVINKHRNLLSLLILSFALFAILLYKYHLSNEEDLNTLLNNIFQFSGIFSALLITFIISKIFQIKQEKLERLKEIINLSNRTTDFRRICKILYDEYNFWDKDMRRKMDNDYKNLNYFNLHIDDNKTEETKKLIDKYLDDKNKFGADFFLGVRSLLMGSKKSFQLELYDDYDHNITYPLKLISQWYGASSANTFWYYLENKWHSYNTAFNFAALSKADTDLIVALAKKINQKKYESATFSKDLLVAIGNDFETSIFPRLFNLTYYNEQGIPSTILLLIRILTTTMVFGVFLPLWLSSIRITNLDIKIFASSISIIILSLSIIYFVLSFKKILECEIKMSNENL